MARTYVDLSVPIENHVKSDPPGLEPSIEYRDHKQTASLVAKRYDGLGPDDLVELEIEKIGVLRNRIVRR